MSNLAILLPLFAQVGLTFVLLFSMARSRVSAIKRGDVKVRDIALGQSNWPERTTQIGNAFHNQFQLPMLFYVLIALAIATGKVSTVLVVLAWVFVALRVVHALVHTGDNNIGRRFNVFAAGFFVLIAMWLEFAVRTILAAS